MASNRAGGAALHAAPFRRPLFDLLHEDVSAVVGVRSDGRRELMLSIRREIALLLNTRREAAGMLDAQTATVLDYGIPNFSIRSVASPPDLKELAALIVNAIEIFEPRLLLPKVLVEMEGSERVRAVVHLSGSIRVGAATEHFTFPLGIDEQTMMTEMPEYETG